MPEALLGLALAFLGVALATVVIEVTARVLLRIL